MARSQTFRWLAVAAMFAALAFGLLHVSSRPSSGVPGSSGETGGDPANPWRHQPIAAVPYVPSVEDELVFRSAAPPSDFGEAMAPYIRRDYAAAEAALARYASTHPGDGRAPFYRGVSLLVLGRDAEALGSLESAAAATPVPEGAEWYLALARLRSDDVDGALRDLDAVAAAPNRYRRDAVRLAREIRGPDAR